MTTKARKITPNLALKSAIAGSGKRQHRVAQLAGISEVRLSWLVCGRATPTATEMKNLARVLDCDKSTLFQMQEAIAS